MTEPRNDRPAGSESDARPAADVRYPTNHVLATVGTPEQLASIVAALTGNGFLESEVGVGCGDEAAERLREATGRRGLPGLAIRLAERLGAADDEMMVKRRYEQALRDGQYVVSVHTPTEDRKQLAARILEEHGASFVNFLGRFTIEAMDRSA
jgi:hypothetical protein